MVAQFARLLWFLWEPGPGASSSAIFTVFSLLIIVLTILHPEFPPRKPHIWRSSKPATGVSKRTSLKAQPKIKNRGGMA